jgi:ribokinase
MSRRRISVVGSINVDLVTRVDRLHDPGETILGSSLELSPGGKGANQALAARRLGADVAMIGAVGRDAHADVALANLRAEGVALAGVAVVDAPTGVAIVEVDRRGENRIIVIPGANEQVRADPLTDDAVLCQAEIGDAALVDLAARARGLVVLNAAPARPLPPQILDRADVVVVNEIEVRGLPALPDRTLVVVTGGSGPVEAYRAGALLHRVPVRQVAAVDTVGAGDAFCAALTVALVDGLETEAALRFAAAAGTVATTRVGAQSAFPTRDDLTDRT